jgi:hypothetical protein
MKLLQWILTGVLAGSCLLAASGCQTSPEYPVESYDAIKRELADQPDIIFPDISKYESSGLLEYVVSLYEKDRNVRIGYAAWTPDVTGKLSLEANTVLTFIGIGCSSLESYDEERTAFILGGTTPTTYRSITLYTFEREDHWFEEEDRLGDRPGDVFPLGTKAGNISYTFDLNGYRYVVDGKTALLPKDQAHTTYEERMSQAKGELSAIVDSILDQGGVTK